MLKKYEPLAPLPGHATPNPATPSPAWPYHAIDVLIPCTIGAHAKPYRAEPSLALPSHSEPTRAVHNSRHKLRNRLGTV